MNYIDKVLNLILEKQGYVKGILPNIDKINYIEDDEYQDIITKNCNTEIRIIIADLKFRGMITIDEPENSNKLSDADKLNAMVYMDKEICNTSSLNDINNPKCNRRTVLTKELCHIPLHRDYRQSFKIEQKIHEIGCLENLLFNYIMNNIGERLNRLSNEKKVYFQEKIKTYIPFLILKGNQIQESLQEIQETLDNDNNFELFEPFIIATMSNYLLKLNKQNFMQNSLELTAYLVHFEFIFPIYIRRQFIQQVNEIQNHSAREQTIENLAKKLGFPIADINLFFNPEFEQQVQNTLKNIAPEYYKKTRLSS